MLAGDRGVDSVAELYAGSYARLVGQVAVASGSRSEAEECVQDAFARLLPRWERVQGYDDPEAWVRGVAFRLLSNRRRKAGNALRALTRLGHATVDGPTGERLDITDALATLPLAQRQVVVLHHLVGLPVDDVARTLSVPVGTVKSRLSRARAALAPLLTEESSRA